MTVMTQLNTNNTATLSELADEFLKAPTPNFIIHDIPRLDPAEKAFWLALLESDEYKGKQGKNALQTPDGKFCCLGVYCDGRKLPQTIKQSSYTVPDSPDRERIMADMVHYGDGEHFEVSIIPQSYAIPWIEKQPDYCFSYGRGFTGDEDLFSCKGQDGKDVMPYGTSWCLPRLNDSGFTFVQIRDIINYFL